jgi:hypothetical protein
MAVHQSNAADEENYLQILQSSSFKERVDALKIIERSAVEDDQLFGYIEQNLIAKYRKDINDANHIDEMAWHCRALASSGDTKYLATLKEVSSTAENKKLERHCSRSIAQFDTYLKIKSTLNKPLIDGYSAEMSKSIHMLQSGEYRMMRDAARHIVKSDEADEKVYDIVRDVLLSETPKVDAAKISTIPQVDILNYLTVCLGKSGLPKYIADLELVRSTTSSDLLGRYAQKAIKELRN